VGEGRHLQQSAFLPQGNVPICRGAGLRRREWPSCAACKALKSDSEVHDAFLTFDEYERLKAIAGQKRVGKRSTLFNDRREWMMLACNSGLRPGEQAMLEFPDIDLVHGFIHVQAKPDRLSH
jgi:integrase